MEGIYFNLEKIIEESEDTYLCSKILGTPVFPEKFLLNKNGKCILNDADYFIMQLNLEDIADKITSLPKKGMLYFFINADTLKTKVLFAKDLEETPLEVWNDINCAFSTEDYGQTNGYKMTFDNNLKEGHYIIGSINPNLDLEMDTDINGYITLLEIDFLSLPHSKMLLFGNLAISGGHYVFLIKENDLKNLNFENVIFIDKEN